MAHCPCTAHHPVQYMFSAGLPDTPAALSTLQHLDTVCWRGCSWQAEPGPLPAGPWLGRLRRLAISCRSLSVEGSLAALSGAQQLERLGVTDTFEESHRVPHGGGVHRFIKSWHTDEVANILAWARGHASLHLLVLHGLPPSTARAAAAARRSRPDLSIQQAKDAEDVYEAGCGYQCQDSASIAADGA